MRGSRVRVTSMGGNAMPSQSILTPAVTQSISRLEMGVESARGSEPSEFSGTCQIHGFCFEA